MYSPRTAKCRTQFDTNTETPIFHELQYFVGFWVVSSSDNDFSDHQNNANDSNELNLNECEMAKTDIDAEVSNILTHDNEPTPLEPIDTEQQKV